MTDLADRLRAEIAAGGPMPLDRFMAAANSHYYAGRDPLGREGDFITAPEISQMFGELIGLGLAELWMRAGRPGPVALVELGPGRGTLMADMRRALSRVAGLAEAPVHLVETSPVLRARQAERLPDAQWHATVDTIPDDAVLLIVANEFFDALPIRQFVRDGDRWRERRVDWRDGCFVAVPDAGEGAIREASPASAAIMAALAARLVRQGGALLVIDYGHVGPVDGDTLQAVRRHGYADPFEQPGSRDLTAHVDFAALAAAARQGGAQSHGPVDQGALLTALGIEERCARLSLVNPDSAAALALERRRLVSPEEMGRLFKAIAVTAPDWPVPAGF